MKKTSFLSLLIISSVAAFVMSSCQKDTTTLRLRFDSFGRNSKVWIDGSTPKWNSDDPVWINENRVEVASAASTITVASAPSYRAVYPFDIVTSYSGNTFNLSIPQEQLYSEVNGEQVVKAPMVAYTTGNTLTFRNLGALLAITVQNNTDNASYAIKEIRVKSKDETLPLWGTAVVSDIANSNASLQCTTATGNNVDPYTVYLRKYSTNNQQVAIYTFTANSGDDSYKTFYVYVPVHGNVNNRFRIEVEPMSGLPVERDQSSASGGNLERNQMVSVPFELNRVLAPNGAVPDGKFSINDAGDQVYFAAGNLQYQRSTNTWRIAPYQEDYIGGGSFTSHISGSDNAYTSSNNASINTDNYAGWIDLFGWGTSGYDNTSNDHYAQRFHPYDYLSTTVTWNDEPSSNNPYGYGPSVGVNNDANFLNGANANYDWGVYHSNVTGNSDHGILQYNGQSVTSGWIWRTLTQGEWKYLLLSRTFGGSTKKGQHWSWSAVTYYGVDGILIYPDGYQGQLTSTSSTHFNFTSTSNPNSIPAGCVFLPNTPQRDGTNVSASVSWGYYWSAQSGSSATADKAYRLRITCNNAGSLTTTDQDFRYKGVAVRLVTDVPNN